ncbi:class I SAM-dependent methyltransferase [Evansella cellulosilytica]|uniref:Uncharacterized protein n=1 Tax=Evansella cellulosilytica (strain ATCC 21833 / DSM 2522 / FERM P-1141 / JCM 9156 / N-4) TaxID=649639 RepID=E6U142_EVAC2|nr:class I SAM-dependent methyltransferase [Evansella cellulosilytica]ADU31488.1 hypothetical protein Bcell_3246 [Evansella cellulosilytica DSM 2522]
MTTTIVEELYTVLDNGSQILQDALNIPYIEAISEMGEVIFHQEVTHNIKEESKQLVLDELKKITDYEAITNEEYRRAIQLAVLKGMKEATQPHHAMTPDAVSLFIGYLVNKILGYDKKGETAIILDQAVGSGNLLTAIMNQTEKSHGIGVEVDETLLKIAYTNANLQKHSVDLFHQDSVATPTVKNVDIIASDLPIGFYPNDDIAKDFVLKSDEGHSFVHHLIIEQGFSHVKEGGFLVFLVPNFLFESQEAKKLHDFIKKEGVIYSFLQLPKSMFKNGQWGKSILILRKKKQGIKIPKEALLVELPSFSNNSALTDMMNRISKWFDSYL